MNDDSVVNASERRSSWPGCAGRAILALGAVIALMFAITFIGGALDSSDNPDDPPLILNAGRADEYARSDVTYFDLQHVYIVRFDDGSFAAFYDRSPKQQELNSDCRIRYDESRLPHGLEQLEGFSGSFTETCNELTTTWRVDGRLASGAGYGNLDRFQTSVDANGDLLVDLSERTCTRSRGVVGIPPFDETTCGRPE